MSSSKKNEPKQHVLQTQSKGQRQESEFDSTACVGAGGDPRAEFFNHLPLGMARVKDHRFVLVNDGICRMLGYTRAELLAVDSRSITHPADQQMSRDFIQERLLPTRDLQSDGLEKRHLKKDGRLFYGRMFVTPMLDEGGELDYWLLQLTDIEETWRARQVQETHQHVLEMLTAGSSLQRILREIIARAEEADPDVRAVIMLLNEQGDAFQQVTAPSMPALFTKSLTGFDVGVGRASCGAAVASNRCVAVEDTASHPDWSAFLGLAQAVDIKSCISHPVADSEGRVFGVFTLIRSDVHRATSIDLTVSTGLAMTVGMAVERHRTIEALRISRARFQTMVDHAPEAVLLFDYFKGRFVEANERVRELYGVSPEEFVSADPWTFSPEFQPGGRRSSELLRERVEATQAGETPIFNYDIRTVDGKPKSCEIRLVRLPTQGGLLFRASVIDVTQHRKAEYALRDSEENLRATLNSIADALIATDRNGLITHFNPVAEEITGVRRAAALGCSLGEVVPLLCAEKRTPSPSLLGKVLRDDTTLIRGGYALLISKDGTERYVSERVAPIRGHQGQVKGMVLVLRDVTDWHASQERALQSRKLEAIGRLAGGIAHDFNNLLTGIMGNADLLSSNLDLEVRFAAEMISKAASRSADVTGQLLRFARNEPTAQDPLDLHALIHEACELMGHDLDKGIELELHFEASNPIVQGDATRLLNAFMNLVLNARDAIEAKGNDRGGGKITIETSSVEIPEPEVQIKVTDNGIGIAPEVQGHIFEPFFTTKKVGAGTGLGLAGIYGTVKTLGGNITVQSERGLGTTFCISLPSSHRSLPPLQAVHASELLAGSGRILVVDDELLVRNFVLRALGSLGYDAIGVEDGIRAEEVYASMPFDLVLLDMLMPRRGGLETYRALAAIRPDVQVIVVSGYTRDHTVDEILEAGAADFLQKPFRLRELSAKVKAVIDGTRVPRP